VWEGKEAYDAQEAEPVDAEVLQDLAAPLDGPPEGITGTLISVLEQHRAT